MWQKPANPEEEGMSKKIPCDQFEVSLPGIDTEFSPPVMHTANVLQCEL